MTRSKVSLTYIALETVKKILFMDSWAYMVCVSLTYLLRFVLFVANAWKQALSFTSLLLNMLIYHLKS